LDDVGCAVGEEHFDVAVGEAVISQHRVDASSVVGVTVTLTPTVPTARHDDRAVADLKQSTVAGVS